MLAAWLAGPPAAASATGQPWGRVDALATGATRPAPAGWLNHCMTDLAACQPVDDAATVPADQAHMALLTGIQHAVNRSIEPRREPPGQDLWSVAPRSGDCEDYALTKQRLLRLAGLPRRAVRLATVELPNGEEHVVLTVETTRGTLVLDNLHAEVMHFNRLGYRWYAIEEPSLGLRWKELRGGRSSPAAILGYEGGMHRRILPSAARAPDQ
ncbi:transglutaminase-like cysteine peptidase [Benzoatithermus flavus]|uniref:Transglutaminase-like cysteine peptidase n=1 Tax=Benzoatithermus flavus TaxID=3108223 RepID=A0ABU8XWM9_9PROT